MSYNTPNPSYDSMPFFPAAPKDDGGIWVLTGYKKADDKVFLTLFFTKEADAWRTYYYLIDHEESYQHTFYHIRPSHVYSKPPAFDRLDTSLKETFGKK